MTEVKSPYNFVPAPTESEVYKPEWANQVSHDIPFSDGESGEITLKITAETPIFIRNGHSKQDADIFEKHKKGELPNPSSTELEAINRYLSFSNINGQYFIPATSIKGMLRNVLEIMSFSRMKQVDEKPFFGLRDMNNVQYKSETNQSQLKSGWLKKEGDQWFMYPVNHVRVPMSDIESKYHISIQNASDAIQKYNLLGNNKDKEVTLSLVKELVKVIKGKNGKPDKQIPYGNLYEFDSSGTFIGNIVLFGNIDNKHYDFVFAKETDIRYSVDTALIEKMDKLDDALWKYHKPSNRIPVFFKLDNNQVKHFGFSKLYRLNNGNSIGDLEPAHSYKSRKKDELDLAQLIFGTVDEKDGKSDALKGRVFISHAFCSDSLSPIPQNTEERVLSSPKPSYYPFYLKQEDNTPYNTYLNNKSVLAGFKRYPVHINPKPNGDHANENIPSNFNPLPARTSFECKIRFHNLRKVELGALLSAITFHNTPNLFHNLGAAKPYGFGKVKLTILNRPEYNQYMAQFENKMNEVLKKEWIQTPQISELFSMAKTPVSQAVDTSLNYPQLESPNDFADYKKATLQLTSYSLANGIVKTTSLLKEAEEQRAKEIQALESGVKEALESRDFETAIECYEKLGKMNIVGFDLNAKLQDVEFKKTKYLSKVEEQRRLEDILSSNDIELITQFLKDYPLSPKKQELEMKLSNLKASSGIPDRLRTMTEWEKFKGEAPRWVKKVKESGEFVKFEVEFQDVVEKVVRVQFESDKTKRAWLKGTFESNHEWKKVTEWLGIDRAKKLYDELTNSK